MVQRVTGFVCLLLTFTALPSLCANATASESGKSNYIQLMFLFLTILILLLIWELVEFFLKKKNEMKAGDSAEVVPVISEEPQEEDPFRALLKEETTEYAAAAGQPKEHQEDEEREATHIAAPQFISEPLPVVEEKKERAKRTVHLDVNEPPVEVIKESPPPPPKASEEKKSVKIAAKSNIDEEGWRDLMQKASKEHDDEAPRKETPVFSKAKETSREEVPENVEEDDPWKALLKKSKQEEEVVKEEEKPWSVFLKSEKTRKGRDDDDEKDSSASDDLPVPAHGDSSVASRVTSKLFSEHDDDVPPLMKEADESPISSSPPWLSAKKQTVRESPDSSTSPPVITCAEDKKEAEILPPFPPSGGTPTSLPSLKPLEQEKKRAISIAGIKTDSDDKARIPEMKHEEKPIPSLKDKKSIDLKTDKKKEEAGDEKKSSSKEATPLFVKKTPRVISIASPDVKDGEGDDAKKGLETGASKEGKKILSIDGIQKKTHDE
ncbi:MAG: hypothetical protein AB2L14_08180 [Candidatus Xenobiia bacterium LiM19]